MRGRCATDDLHNVSFDLMVVVSNVSRSTCAVFGGWCTVTSGETGESGDEWDWSYESAGVHVVVKLSDTSATAGMDCVDYTECVVRSTGPLEDRSACALDADESMRTALLASVFDDSASAKVLCVVHSD